MATEYKKKSDIPDLYHILGLTSDVCKEPNCAEIIQKAYVKKAKLCHPDKHPGRKDIGEVFELLTSAYDILRDEKQRTAYNHKLTLNKQSSGDFLKLKKEASEYMESLGEFRPPTDQQKLTFKDQMGVLDAKHGYDTGMMGAISEQDARKKLNDLAKTRSEQDRDLKPEKLFDGPIDLKRFNAAFDKIHNREDTAMVQHNGVPTAWNDAGSVTPYSTFDNLDNLYTESGNRFDSGNQTYGNADFGTPMQKISKEDIQNIRGADYVDGHNVLGDDYYKEMKAKLRERESEATTLENMKYGDFRRDDTAGYGIFNQLGMKFDDRLALDVEADDISKKFDKLMAERQKDLLPGTSQQPIPQKKPQVRGPRGTR